MACRNHLDDPDDWEIGNMHAERPLRRHRVLMLRLVVMGILGGLVGVVVAAVIG